MKSSTPAQRHMFNEFKQALPLRQATPREGFRWCEDCKGSGQLFDPLRICGPCGGLGQVLL